MVELLFLIGRGLLDEDFGLLVLDLLFELVHGLVVELELFLEFEDLLLDLGVWLELGLVLFGLEEFLHLLVECCHLLLQLLVLSQQVLVYLLQLFG